MCTVSNIGDIYGRTFPQRWPNWIPDVQLTPPAQPFNPLDLSNLLRKPDDVTREEFNALKAELEEVKALLQAAKKFDTQTGQPDCENADKIALFRKLADLVGIDISDIFGGSHASTK